MQAAGGTDDQQHHTTASTTGPAGHARHAGQLKSHHGHVLSITRRPGTRTVGQLDPIPTVLYYRHGLCTLSALPALSFCTAAAAALCPTGKLLFRKRRVFSPEEPAEQQHASILAKIVVLAAEWQRGQRGFLTGKR